MRISIRITDEMKSALQKLVKRGDYMHISEAIREAIRILIADKKEEKEKHGGTNWKF
ncbi:MAG TPA: ribbon-helix-helix domain-containing protein [Candidatus Brocadiaceae bacterium]|nr:ribbon-helix-helix domain-containing protein [Candidatus Brocadiaceae bacterium]